MRAGNAPTYYNDSSGPAIPAHFRHSRFATSGTAPCRRRPTGIRSNKRRGFARHTSCAVRFRNATRPNPTLTSVGGMAHVLVTPCRRRTFRDSRSIAPRKGRSMAGSPAAAPRPRPARSRCAPASGGPLHRPACDLHGDTTARTKAVRVVLPHHAVPLRPRPEQRQAPPQPVALPPTLLPRRAVGSIPAVGAPVRHDDFPTGQRR